jgi:DnaJ-class molecular chaperone
MCPLCHGEGGHPNGVDWCPECDGTGRVGDDEAEEASFDCGPCAGTGEGYAGRRCPSCRGSGLDRMAIRAAYAAGREEW